MKIEIEDCTGANNGVVGKTAQKIADMLDAAPYGKLYTTAAIAEKFKMRRNSVDHYVHDLRGYSALRLVGRNWRRLLGNKKTIAALAKEDGQ